MSNEIIQIIKKQPNFGLYFNFVKLSKELKHVVKYSTINDRLDYKLIGENFIRYMFEFDHNGFYYVLTYQFEFDEFIIFQTKDNKTNHSVIDFKIFEKMLNECE